MNTRLKKTSVLLMAAMAIVAGTAAGARAEDTVTAKVPFAFQVGGTAMPAGTYTVSYKVEQPNAITITAASGEHVSIVLGVALANDTRPTEPRFEFRRSGAGGGFYLARVVLSNDDGREISLPASAAASRSH